ncbi:MAG TPA: archease [Candidatus Poseidoniales archaeon]|nr:archease [Candidatus Poseidoniales archaeon]
MSWWISPTTADTGIRAFEPDFLSLFSTVLEGMQSMILNRTTPLPPDVSIRTSEVSLDVEYSSDEQVLVSLLEEALYEAEVHDRWWVQANLAPAWFEIRQGSCRAVVCWIPISDVKPAIHIKAITRHDLIVEELGDGEIRVDPAGVGPEFVGPGHHAHVIFDV